MAPARSNADGADREDGVESDRKVRRFVSAEFQEFTIDLREGDPLLLFLWQARKPLVEKKRRARITKSLQELRLLIADTDVRDHLQLFVANE